MKKIVIVINGQGGVGKDAFCGVAKSDFVVKVVSSIDRTKMIAKLCQWDGEKNDRNRKFLSDLKLLLTNYNDLPFRDMIREVIDFKNHPDQNVLFVHIREPEEIKKFVETAKKHCPVVTLLVTRPQVEREFGNMADDNVKNYPYDFTFENSSEALGLLAVDANRLVKFILDGLPE
jgi:hypothetical protein